MKYGLGDLGLNPELSKIEQLPSWKASESMAEKNMLKRVGDSTQPCLTPFVTGNGSEDSMSSKTHANMPSWNCVEPL